MHDKYDTPDSLVSWMIAGGARIDQPDPRHVTHLVAIRDAARAANDGSPLARMAAWIGLRPPVTAAAATSAAITSADVTTCCAPA